MANRKPNPSGLLEIVGRLQREINSYGMGPQPQARRESQGTWLERFDQVMVYEPLRAASRRLFADAHYARAVEEAFKCLNNVVKEKSGLDGLDGDALMRQAFSAQNPAIRINRLKSVSEKDEQRGYMELYAGAMTGIRNPRAHEHQLEDTPEAALEMLTIANHLFRKLESSRRRRNKKRGASTGRP